MSNWQPIDTAPKEKDVLIFAAGKQYVAVFRDGNAGWWWYVDDNKNGPYPLRGGSPTHWMPLQDPPNE